jgi:hypothetical protein
MFALGKCIPTCSQSESNQVHRLRGDCSSDSGSDYESPSDKKSKSIRTGRPVRLLVVLLLCSAFSAAGKTCIAQEDLANAFADAPDAILWNFKLFYLLPKNLKEFQRAFEDEQNKLTAGESKEFRVIFAMVGDEPFRFIRLSPAELDLLLPANQQSVGKITIEKTRYVVQHPLEPIQKELFDTTLGKQFPTMTYADHEHVVSIWNAQNGFAAPDSQIKMVDLLDQQARSGAAGTIILTADASEPKYHVFNTQTRRSESATKGDTLKAAGNSIWVLTKFSDGSEYVIAYRRLNEKPSIQPGADVKAGDVIGEFSKESGSRLEVWRVSGPSQYFLRNGARRVAPLAP